MKTYTKKTESPLLEISYDKYAESPRQLGDGVGFFLVKEGRFESPDGTKNRLYSIIMETEGEATDLEEHIKLIKKMAKKEFKETGDDDLDIAHIYPVMRYEHGRVAYRLGVGSGFDISNCGFFIVPKKLKLKNERETMKFIDQEISIYNQWCNGEVYEFVLFNENGEVVDRCGGFYDVEEIRDYLPDGWVNEKLKDYIV